MIDDLLETLFESNIVEDFFVSSEDQDRIDTFSATLGLGPKYKPKTSKKYGCPECHKNNATFKEIHPDTDMNDVVLSCPDCGFLDESIKQLISESSVKDRLGDCYRLSGRYVSDNENAILVHGSINGIRWTGKDFDNPHAWVEEGDEVLDVVWDKRFPKEMYYEIMQVKVDHKYTHEKVLSLMLKHGHWGPW